MRLICLFIAMISGSFAVAATVSTESDGLVVTLKNDTNGHPVDSIKDGSKRDYKYLVDIINSCTQNKRCAF